MLGVVHIALVAIVIRDYDPAISFFVGTLGFELVEDSPAMTNDGRPKRWVVVLPSGAATSLLLTRADGEAQAAGQGGLFVHAEDFDAAHQRMTAARVEFISPPRSAPRA